MAIKEETIQEPVRKLRKLLKKMPSPPTPQEIHGFRTSSRRLEAAMQALSMVSGRERRIVKRISKLRKRAGKIRDMDVLTEHASSIDAGPKEKECMVQLLEHLGAERQQQVRKFDSATQKYGPKLRRRLKNTESDLENLLNRSRGNGSRGNDASGNAGASALKRIVDLEVPARLNKTNLHQYRLKVKELRDLLLLADTRGAKPPEFVTKLGDVKDAIGEWHDWEELTKVAGQVLEHGSRCQLIRELSVTSEQKYNHALSLTQAMRKKYIPVHRRRTKSVSRHDVRRVSAPVWSAATTLAA